MSVKMPLYAYSVQKRNAPERMLVFVNKRKSGSGSIKQTAEKQNCL